MNEPKIGQEHSTQKKVIEFPHGGIDQVNGQNAEVLKIAERKADLERLLSDPGLPKEAAAEIRKKIDQINRGQNLQPADNNDVAKVRQQAQSTKGEMGNVVDISEARSGGKLLEKFMAGEISYEEFKVNVNDENVKGVVDEMIGDNERKAA